MKKITSILFAIFISTSAISSSYSFALKTKEWLDSPPTMELTLIDNEKNTDLISGNLANYLETSYLSVLSINQFQAYEVIKKRR